MMGEKGGRWAQTSPRGVGFPSQSSSFFGASDRA